MTTASDRILSPQAAADHVGCGRSSIVRALQNRELLAERGNDRRWRIHLDDLERWAADRSVTAQVSPGHRPDIDRTPDRTGEMDRLREERDAALREVAKLRSEREEALRQAAEGREAVAELRGELTSLRGHVVSVELDRDRWYAKANLRPLSLIERIWGSRSNAGA
jgi:excisionase family DNA binding protein